MNKTEKIELLNDAASQVSTMRYALKTVLLTNPHPLLGLLDDLEKKIDLEIRRVRFVGSENRRKMVS